MTDRLFVKPAQVKPAQPDAERADLTHHVLAADGVTALKVRKPTGGHLAESGEWVPRESYWLRRLADGDVVEADAPADDAADAVS